MTPPTLEVADILRAQGDRFLERYRSSFDFQQLKAFRAILRCRTAARVRPRYPFFLPVKVLSRVFRGKFSPA